MFDPNCDIKVGHHDAPYWIAEGTSLIVCNFHKEWYENDTKFASAFKWVEYTPPVEKKLITFEPDDDEPEEVSDVD